MWRPNPGPQTRFLATRADEALYGGAAGGGKSAAALATPLRWVHNPGFRALVLRRETPQLRDLLDKSAGLYSQLGATFNGSTGTWVFPSGARVWFTHCEHENDVGRFDGHEFQVVVFDELTHFTERQYRGIRARIRGTDPTLPRWSRATTNPGGIGHDWVKRRFGAWLDPKHARPARPGEVRAYRGEEEVPRGTPEALGRTFIPARLADNPHVGEEYRAQLRDLDPVRRAQLLEGDWEAAYGEGKLFHRDWWTYIDAAPPVRRRWRSWDFGATTSGDATAGVLLGDRGPSVVPRWVVLDVVTLRAPPHEVRALVHAIAARDGKDCGISVPQDPGQAGVEQAQSYTRDLAGYTIHTRRPTGDKTVRAGPFSAQVGARNAAVVRAPWTPSYVAEMHAFPDGSHDDAVDASSDAFAELSAFRETAPARTTILRTERTAGW